MADAGRFPFIGGALPLHLTSAKRLRGRTTRAAKLLRGRTPREDTPRLRRPQAWHAPGTRPNTQATVMPNRTRAIKNNNPTA
jgi:hypothetical protein